MINLSVEDIDSIGFFLGYPNRDPVVLTSTVNLNEFTIAQIQNILDEIQNLSTLFRSTSSISRVTKIEDITLNMNYRKELKESLEDAIRRLSFGLNIPIRTNFFITELESNCNLGISIY